MIGEGVDPASMHKKMARLHRRFRAFFMAEAHLGLVWSGEANLGDLHWHSTVVPLWLQSFADSLGLDSRSIRQTSS